MKLNHVVLHQLEIFDNLTASRGGRLHTKCTQMCVLRTEKYTHFVGHCLHKNIPIMKGFFITDTPY